MRPKQAIRLILKLLMRVNFPLTLEKTDRQKINSPSRHHFTHLADTGRNFSPVVYTCDPVVLTLWRCITQTAKDDFVVLLTVAKSGARDAGALLVEQEVGDCSRICHTLLRVRTLQTLAAEANRLCAGICKPT
jgi:hypothetical protein